MRLLCIPAHESRDRDRSDVADGRQSVIKIRCAMGWLFVRGISGFVGLRRPNVLRMLGPGRSFISPVML